MAGRQRSTLLLAAMVLVALVGLGTFAVSTVIRSPAERLASAKPPKPTLLTAPVKSGSLDDTASLPGRLVWPRLRTIAVSLDPSRVSIVTGKPTSAGHPLRAGSVLVEISDRPVFVLQGQIPMLRDLRAGDHGADVARFQAALVEAGYGVADTSGAWGPSTSAALTRLYADHGYRPPHLGDDAEAVYAAKSELVFVPTLPATVVKLP